MPKTSQNILIFIDSAMPFGYKYYTPTKIAMSYMNRFTIDEDASFELIGIHHVPLWRYQGGGQYFFFNIVTAIRRKIPIWNIRESETHFMFSSIFSPHELVVMNEGNMHSDVFNMVLSIFNLKSAMVTKISMMRQELITKEMMEAFPKGEERIKQSIHDDLDIFFERLQFDFNYRIFGRNEFNQSYLG